MVIDGGGGDELSATPYHPAIWNFRKMWEGAEKRARPTTSEEAGRGGKLFFLSLCDFGALHLFVVRVYVIYVRLRTTTSHLT